MLYRQH